MTGPLVSIAGFQIYRENRPKKWEDAVLTTVVFATAFFAAGFFVGRYTATMPPVQPLRRGDADSEAFVDIQTPRDPSSASTLAPDSADPSHAALLNRESETTRRGVARSLPQQGSATVFDWVVLSSDPALGPEAHRSAGGGSLPHQGMGTPGDDRSTVSSSSTTPTLGSEAPRNVTVGGLQGPGTGTLSTWSNVSSGSSPTHAGTVSDGEFVMLRTDVTPASSGASSKPPTPRL